MAPDEFEMTGNAGEPIDLPITVGPATGYVWMLELPDGVIRLGDGPGRPIPQGRELGGTHGGAVRIQADRGAYRVVARLARPWEPDQPVRVVHLHITVC